MGVKDSDAVIALLRVISINGGCAWFRSGGSSTMSYPATMGDWHWCARGFVSESTGVWWKMTCWLLAVALGCAVEQGAVAMSYGSLWLEGAWAVRFDRVGLMSDVKVWANGLAGSFPSIFWFFLVFEISLGLIS